MDTRNSPDNEMRAIQEKRIKQLIMEFRNPQGAVALAEEYRLTREEIDQILRSIRKEAEERKILDKRQFDIKTMRYLSLEEWIKEYF
ncbi:MAG: hypothetical protein HXY46_03045 [Syntrophaceae bacterium]|nr:hypothetical protein [Syntrophaceae bacterium]